MGNQIVLGDPKRERRSTRRQIQEIEELTPCVFDQRDVEPAEDVRWRALRRFGRRCYSMTGNEHIREPNAPARHGRVDFARWSRNFRQSALIKGRLFTGTKIRFGQKQINEIERTVDVLKLHENTRTVKRRNTDERTGFRNAKLNESR